MNIKFRQNSIFIWKAILKSYAQVFFSESKLFAVILLLVSFMDWWTGVCGLTAIIIAIGLAKIFEYDETTIQKGLFSFNSLLVGLGIGTYFSPGLEVLFLLVIGSALAFFVTVILMGVFAKYGLPFLSLPFLVAIWVLMLSFPAFTNIDLNSEALFPSNMFHKIGGNPLVSLMNLLDTIFLDTSFGTYFLSLGAIFFQFNILAGLLIAIGLLVHSRVHFLFSLIGFFVAYWFYSFLGLYTGSLNYTYYGFNFVLSAIAIGGYFLIPSRQSLLWSVFLIPVLVVVTIGSDRLFALFELSVFSLPFNLVLIGVLYAFKIRFDQTKPPNLTYIQQRNPETNAYLFDSQSNKEYAAFVNSIRLPFMGKWFINQGHNGNYTHKGFYKFAWDFIIKDDHTKLEFLNDGYVVSDYFCFGKPVISPAEGVVVAVVNTVEDNEIGIANTIQNWGNTVVIKHDTFLYSKLSHLQKNSIKVVVGESVYEGQELGKCGNSGRSPYPHLHFQLQASSKIGSPALFYPLEDFIVEGEIGKQDYIQKGIPLENCSVSNINASTLLFEAFKWNPGDEFTIELHDENSKIKLYEIENQIDIYNQSFLVCIKTGAKLYYKNNNKTFDIINYTGSQKSPLAIFYKSLYKVVFTELTELSIISRFPIHHLYTSSIRIIQDFLVPFGIFLKGKYQLNYKKNEMLFNQKEVELNSIITGNNNKKLFSAEITIGKNKEIGCICKQPNKNKIHLKWAKKQD